MRSSILAATLAFIAISGTAFGETGKPTDYDVMGFPEITSICDFKQPTPQGECRGFLLGVIEEEFTQRLFASPEDRLIPLCAKHESPDEIVAKVWDSLRARPIICAGFCPADSDVAVELNRLYRCTK